MRQPEAEAEAARRNLEDEKRDRYVFYALDISAGLSDDAWEVSRRLRRPDEALQPVVAAADAEAADAPAPVTPAARAARSARGVAARARAGLPRGASQARRRRRPEAVAPQVAGDGTGLAAEEVPHEFDELAPPPARGRGTPLLRIWAVLVILIGVLFLATTLVIAFSLRDYFRLGALPVLVGLAVGGFTVWLGVALWRS
jgi:hypothetical protein